MVRKAYFLILAAPLFFPFALSAAEDARSTRTVSADGEAVQVRVVAGEYFFKPSRLTAKVDKPVELLVSREAGIVPHSLVIDAPAAGINIREDLSTEPRKVTFTPTTAGIYPFHCDKKLLFFAGHREKGMEGVLEVVP